MADEINNLISFNEEELRRVHKNRFKESNEIFKKIVALIDDEVSKLDGTEYNEIHKIMLIHETLLPLNAGIFIEKIRRNKI